MKNNKKVFLKAQLTLAIFVLIILLISGFFIFGPSLSQVAKALTGDYSKPSSGAQLTVDDWNRLDVDFLDKVDPAGDSMAGPLTLPSNPTNSMHAATKLYTDNKIGSISIGGLRIFCGESSPANWEQYEEGGVPQIDELTTYVNTSAGNFSVVVMYITALDGVAGIWRTTGGSSIYEHSNTGFRVYIDDYNPDTMTPAQALSWDWKIKWCAVGI